MLIERSHQHRRRVALAVHQTEQTGQRRLCDSDNDNAIGGAEREASSGHEPDSVLEGDRGNDSLRLARHHCDAPRRLPQARVLQGIQDRQASAGAALPFDQSLPFESFELHHARLREGMVSGDSQRDFVPRDRPVGKGPALDPSPDEAKVPATIDELVRHRGGISYKDLHRDARMRSIEARDQLGHQILAGAYSR